MVDRDGEMAALAVEHLSGADENSLGGISRAIKHQAVMPLFGLK